MNGSVGETTASIRGRRKCKKRRFVSSSFRQTKYVASSRCGAASRAMQIQSTTRYDQAHKRQRNSTRAKRDAETHRLQRGGAAAPASAIGLLECEGLLDSDPVRDRKTVPARRRRLCLAGFQIPAGAGAAGCDRAAGREGGEQDNFDLGGHQRALLGDLAVDLDHPDGPEEIAAAIGDMNLRDAEIDGVGIG